MNFLSPDDIFSGVRRKSLCNGSLLALSSSSKQNAESGSSTPSKSKKERRRGSFNEVNVGTSSGTNHNTGRRSSLVSRWFKHISDAAEQYKPRTKSANHEPIDDPAIATLPHSNTRESLELTPERPPPQSATATVVTTPLAPMMPILPNVMGYDKVNIAQNIDQNCSNNNTNTNNCNSNSVEVQLRNGRRENTHTSPGITESCPPYYNVKQRLSQNELGPNAGAVNRTMSTRSCGEANNNYNNMSEFAAANGVTLRHTQSARQANNGILASDDAINDGNKRDSTSIVYSNNSNNTRTLMQSPLEEPTAIQISISPAHTAEPVLTLVEKLRRLDASIREGLMEKQKIICDMFRLPIEHFHEIVDIAAMPEAPKDSADIALAAYAQVQSLTEVINEYMQITPEQEISAVSTAVCDKCHEKQQHLSNREKTTFVKSDTPPPLPPPKKQIAQAQQQVPTPTVPKLQMLGLAETDIHEDDDGYCEIDELRLPALPHLMKTISPALSTAKVTVTPSFPASLSKSVTQLQSPVIVTESQTSNSTGAVIQTNSTPELTKRQSTLSSDSIPEESPDEVTNALNDHHIEEMQTSNESKDDVVLTAENIEQKQQATSVTASDHDVVPSKQLEEKNTETQENSIREDSQQSETGKNNNTDKPETEGENKEVASTEEEEKKESEDDSEDKDDDSTMHTAECESASLEIKEPVSNETTEHLKHSVTTTTSVATEPKKQQTSNSTQADDSSLDSENVEINEVYETFSSLKKHENAALIMVDNSTQTIFPSTQHSSSIAISPTTTAATNTQERSTSTVATNTTTTTTTNTANAITASLCGPNRIQHAHTLEPSVPCHALNNIVSALNAQISLLLPKINERDMERDRLRKENLHLQEEKHSYQSTKETPNESIIINACKTDDQIDGSSPAPSVTAKSMPTIALTGPIEAQPLITESEGAEHSKTDVETNKLTTAATTITATTTTTTTTTMKPPEAKN
uniref:Uncharacterized protein n=1 Tax=Glossina brevipalpis TaxID=37001 RepID=A0A1A9WDU2_9MUSC